MFVTSCVVVPFDRVEGGSLVPSEAKEAQNLEAAKRRAEAMPTKHAGALAFSRTADPDSGNFADAEVIAVYGAVNAGALRGQFSADTPSRALLPECQPRLDDLELRAERRLHRHNCSLHFQTSGSHVRYGSSSLVLCR